MNFVQYKWNYTQCYLWAQVSDILYFCKSWLSQYIAFGFSNILFFKFHISHDMMVPSKMA